MTAELETDTELSPSDMSEQEVIDAPEGESEQHKQLAFSFAKRHKVLVDTGEQPAIVYHTDGTDFRVFAEVRRFSGTRLCVAGNQRRQI